MSDLLWRENVDGSRDLCVDEFEYTPLNHDVQETRFLTVHPCDGDKNAIDNIVRCDLEIKPLANESPRPFTAVFNARGYRLLQDPIMVNGRALLISCALERFLRNFRKSDEPVRLWVRHICLDERNNDERQRYWNRPYMDVMYGQAQSRVDMADFVSALRERGVVRAVRNSDQQPRRKTWNKTVQSVSPAIFPFRIGKKPCWDEPVDDYEYLPLDMVADEFRVLDLAPSEDRRAPIVANLGHCDLGGPVTYIALSYTWGEDGERVDINVGGQKMSVRQNLYEALGVLRRSTGHLPVWVDAVCINQSDVVEKNRQLVRMADIYDDAGGVFCYTGRSDEDSKMAVQFVPFLRSPLMLLDDNRDWICQTGKGQRMESSQIPRHCGALYRFVTRPYFRRVWILQEIARASFAIVVGGHEDHVDIDDLDHATSNLADMLRRDRRLADQMMECTPGLSSVSADVLASVRKVFYFRHLSMRSHFSRRSTTISPRAPGYLETAILTRDFEATVPSDKIYALWNLARDKDDFRFQMDYHQSTAEAFTSFATAWATHSGSLDVIGAAEPYSGSFGFYHSAPAWVPDWSVPSQVSCLVRKEAVAAWLMQYQNDLDGPLYRADGAVRQSRGHDNYFHFDGDVLCCTGVILDQLEYFIQEAEVGETPLERFSRWVSPVESFYELHHDKPCPYDDPLRAAWALSFGDNVAAWPRRENNVANALEDHPDEECVCLPALSRHVRTFGSSYSRLDTFEVGRMVARGRDMVITQQGYLALVPIIVRRPARTVRSIVFAVLATCSVPVLLAEQFDGTYTFVGTALVQGWMDGEMVTDYMGVETAQEFWDSLEGTEKLRIR